MSKFVLGATTVYVARSGHQFSMLDQALAWINSKILMAPVTVQVLAGTYDFSTFRYGFQLNNGFRYETGGVVFPLAMQAPHFVAFIGNLTNPATVKLQFTNIQYYAAINFGPECRGIVFAGFSIMCSGGSPGCDGYGINAYNGAMAFATQNLVSGFTSAWGAVAQRSSWLDLSQTTITSCSQGVVVTSNSYAYLYYVTVSGTNVANSYGVQVSATSSAETPFVSVSNVATGVSCDATSSVKQSTLISYGSNVPTSVSCSNMV